ncbi:MAG: hypothetical protein WCX29_01095 [Candidatus Peribacteraceae bacterium]
MKDAYAENRLVTLKIGENFKQLAADNFHKPTQAIRDGKIAGGALGYGVSAWDIVTRSGDALVQGIADKKITDANVLRDIKNVATSTVSAIGKLITLKPIQAGKEVLSGVSSAFQAPQSLITQMGRSATGTDYKTAA